MKLEDLETIFDALNHASVRYLIAGGIAVNIHGYQRMTADLDLVIQLTTDNIIAALSALETLSYQPLIPVTTEEFSNHSIRQSWIEQKNMQVLGLQSAHFPATTIDIFVAEPFDFEVEYLNADQFELTPSIDIKVVNIKTLIEMKRSSGRARDLDDIEHLQLILEEGDER